MSATPQTWDVWHCAACERAGRNPWNLLPYSGAYFRGDEIAAFCRGCFAGATDDHQAYTETAWTFAGVMHPANEPVARGSQARDSGSAATQA